MAPYLYFIKVISIFLYQAENIPLSGQLDKSYWEDDFSLGFNASVLVGNKYDTFYLTKTKNNNNKVSVVMEADKVFQGIRTGQSVLNDAQGSSKKRTVDASLIQHQEVNLQFW